MSQCGICSDLFDGVERIATTPCGHVYHTKCLLKWLDVSKTCPECRKKVSSPNVVELYFNISNTESVNPLSLCNEVENLKSLLQERRIEACDLYNKNTELCKMVAEHESKISSLQQVNMNLEHELNKCLSEIPLLRLNLEKTKRINTELENELHFLQDIKTVVAGAQEDADEILLQAAGRASSGTDLMVSRRLATCCSLTKRELRRVIDDKNKLRKEIIEMNKNLGLTASKLRLSKASVKELKKRIEQLEGSKNVSLSGFELQESFHSEPSTSHSSSKTGRSPSKYLEVTPISSGSEKKEKKKMNVVVLDKEKEKVSVLSERSVSPVLFSPILKRRKETDSVLSTGYNGLGGHHSIIIRAEDLPKVGKPKKYALVPTKKKFRKL